MPSAAQYLRVSTDKQRYSLECQVEVISRFAREQGYDIVRTYEDAARSGVSIAGRDGLKALLRDVMAGAPFTTVLVLDVSRWGRFQDPDQAAHYEFLCREAGVTVRYCAEAFDDDGTPASTLLKSIKRVMAAEYSRQLSDRCRGSLRRHMLSGGKCGGIAPYGFARQLFDADGHPGRVLGHGERRGPGQVVRLVPGAIEEQEVVRLIFRLFVDEALGATRVANRLSALGVAYRNGQPWNENRVRGVLTNEIAVGIYRFNRTHHRFKTITKNRSDQWMRVKVCEPIVSRSQWDAVQLKLRELKRSPWTDGEMLRKLRQLRRKHRKLTRRLIDSTPGVPSVKAYENHFGSVDAAWAQIGYVSSRKSRRLSPPSVRDPAEIIRQLQELNREAGFVSGRLIERSPLLPSVHFIRRTFGSMADALKAAGINSSQGERIKAGKRENRLARSLAANGQS